MPCSFERIFKKFQQCRSNPSKNILTGFQFSKLKNWKPVLSGFLHTKNISKMKIHTEIG